LKGQRRFLTRVPEFRTGKAADIVGTLVSIYETKEVIVKELQSYLALRLLAIDDYDSVKEVSRARVASS
jgi:anaphase-promoting complex subunit 2